jgi:hypothetical protein
MLVGRVDHVRGDPGGVHHADPHPEVADLRPQRVGERLDPGLGRRVRGVARDVHDRGERRHEQRVALALDEVRQRHPDGAPHAEQVDVDDPLERRRVDGPGEAGGGDARVGQHHVDPAVSLDHGGRGLLEVGPAGDVGFPPAGVGSAVGGDLGQLLGLEADERHGGALGRQITGDARADSPGRPGDQHDFAPHVAFPAEHFGPPR